MKHVNMKHPKQNTEDFDFNLGQAPELRCLQISGTTTCGQCQNCRLREIVLRTRQWFPRAGERTKRQLVHGLIRRARSSPQLLEYVGRVLAAIEGKDYAYARSRPVPSLEGDRVDAGVDRALSVAETKGRMSDLYGWYRDAPYWSKANYLLAVLQMCDGQLLHTTATLVRTVLSNRATSVQTQLLIDDEDYENESLADTVCSYESHPENDLLRCSSVDYDAPITEIIANHPDGPDTDGTSVEDAFHVTVDADTDEDSDDSSVVDPNLLVPPVFRRSLAGAMKHRDFIRDLPVHLSKYILSFLEYAHLVSCLEVSNHWHVIAGEVTQDMRFSQAVYEEVMLMQGSSSKGGNPVYASYIPVDIPQIVPGSFEVFISESSLVNVNFKNEIDIETSYSGLATSAVSMEARNVYCGPYNVMVLSDEYDYNRIVHYNFSDLIAVGSFDRHVHFIDVNSGNEVGPIIRGHAGSIQCLYINAEEGYVLTGSFDTSIRCWHITTGKPMKIFNGHRGTIRCLDMFGDRLVSGSKDNSVKVWMFSSGKCIRTFKHAKRINCVSTFEDIVVSGCEGGRVKVWSIEKACSIKMLYKSPRDRNQYGLSDPHTHTGPIRCVKVDRYHIASGSTDGYALVWSAIGDVNKCVRALRHPGAVLCLSMIYLRIVTGCEDGKLRIWNMLTGDCLRVMRGNSRSDPILTMYPCGNKLALNTVNNLLILNFEDISWDYTQEEKVDLLRYKHDFKEASLRQHSYPYVRAQRSERAMSANPRLISEKDPGSGPWVNKWADLKATERPLSHSGRVLSPTKQARAEQIQRCYQNVKLTASAKGSIYQNLTDAPPRSSLNPKRRGSGQRISSAPAERHHMLSSRTHSGSTFRPKSSISLTSHSFGSSPNKSKELITKCKSVESVRYDGEDLSGSNGNLSQGLSYRSNTPPSTAKSSSSLCSTRSRLHMPLRTRSAPLRERSIKTSSSVELSKARSLQNAEARIERKPVTRDKLVLSVSRLEGSKLQDSVVMLNTSANMFALDARLAVQSSPQSKPRCDGKKIEISTEKDYVLSETVVTPIQRMSLDSQPCRSIHSKESVSTIPKSGHSRPQTALTRVKSRSEVKVLGVQRCKSASVSRSGWSDGQLVTSPLRKKKSHGFTTSCTETMLQPPMLMHGPSRVEKSKDKEFTAKTKISIMAPTLTPVVEDPFESHGGFHLRSRKQLEVYLNGIEAKQRSGVARKQREDERIRKAAWEATATGRNHRD